MKYTYSKELASPELEQEIRPLAARHNAEIGGIMDQLPVKPNLATYMAMEAHGLLRLYTMRDEAGVLVGYCICAFIDHPQYQGHKFAAHEALYVEPAHRVGRNSIRLMDFCDQQLKADGAVFVTQHVMRALDYSPILLRMGYSLTETIYAKQLNPICHQE